MATERKDEDIPSPIIALLKHLKLKITSKGVCQGLAYLAANAITLKQINPYIKRIEQIYNPSFFGQFANLQFIRDMALKEAQNEVYLAMKKEDSQASFDAWYQALPSAEKSDVQKKLKVKTNEKIAQRFDAEILRQHEDIEIFLQATYMLYAPFKLTEYFPKEKMPIAQDSLAVFPLIMPSASETQGGLTEVKHTIGVYSEKKLDTYFSSLLDEIRKSKYEFPMSFVLEATSHTITVGYMPSETPQWIVANPYAFPKFTRTNDVKEVAKAVMASFPGNEKVTFVSRILVAGNNKAQATDLVNNWLKPKEHSIFTAPMEKIQKITAKKAKHIDHQGGSLLYLAARTGNLGMMEELFKLGADPNPDQKFKNKKLPLAIAIFWQQTAAVEKLLKNKAHVDAINPEAKDDFAYKPIYIAAKFGNAAIMELLLSYKANPNEVFENDKRNTPLHVAASHGRNDVIEKLLACGANLNAKNKFGDSVLDSAIKADRPDTVELLLKSGAEFSRQSYATLQTALAAENDPTRKAVLTKIESLLKDSLATLKESKSTTPKKEDSTEVSVPKKNSM